VHSSRANKWPVNYLHGDLGEANVGQVHEHHGWQTLVASSEARLADAFEAVQLAQCQCVMLQESQLLQEMGDLASLLTKARTTVLPLDDCAVCIDTETSECADSCCRLGIDMGA
jgi:hypothetical protein